MPEQVMEQSARIRPLAEIYNKDPEFINRRVNEILLSLPEWDREQVLTDFRAKASLTANNSVMILAGLLESHFQHLYKEPLLTNESISSPTMVPSTSMSDRHVGDYQFVKTLGKGTFGKVKLAQHKITRKMVAIKIMEKANIKTTKQRISVQREVRLMKLLNHPHIVSALEVFESAEHYWIVMEHAPSGELFDYIVKNGMIKEPEARRFFRQILSAVEYCHLNSIIHRDLKPENLLLDSNFNIKIIDFGFGNTFHRDRFLDTYCGSPFYAAPEMIQGIRYIGPEVDVWSLGVILFALLSGRLPFDATTMNELYEKIAKGKYVCPQHFSSDIVHLISRMLEVNPAKRATLAEIKHHVWVNQNYDCMPSAFVPPRPRSIATPHPDSYRELMSYGFRTEDAMIALTTDVGPHPITSLYYLIEEARQRRVLAQSAHTKGRAKPTIAAKYSATANFRPPAIHMPKPPLVSDESFDRIAAELNVDNGPDGSDGATTAASSASRTPSPSKEQRCSSPAKVVKGLFNFQTTSTLPYSSLCAEIERALHASGIAYERNGESMVYICDAEKGNRFEIEMAPVSSGSSGASTAAATAATMLPVEISPEHNCYGAAPGKWTATDGQQQDYAGGSPTFDIYVRRLRGNLWTHKRVCGRLLEQMNL